MTQKVPKQNKQNYSSVLQLRDSELVPCLESLRTSVSHIFSYTHAHTHAPLYMLIHTHVPPCTHNIPLHMHTRFPMSETPRNTPRGPDPPGSWGHWLPGDPDRAEGHVLMLQGRQHPHRDGARESQRRGTHGCARTFHASGVSAALTHLKSLKGDSGLWRP